MSALDNAEKIKTDARNLVEDTQKEDITITEARTLISLIRQTEGWLLSAKTLLNPSEIL